MRNLIIAIIFMCFTLGMTYSQVSQVWKQYYNGTSSGNDIATSLALDINGNVYVTGSSEGTNSYDAATVKYNNSGIQQWVAIYNDTENRGDGTNAIAVDVNGNVYVAGYSGSVANFSNYVTIKYDPNGIQQWVGLYNGLLNGNDEAKSIAVDIYGNVYVTGTSRITGVGSDFVTIKYNSSGVQEWLAVYNGPANDNDVANSVAVDLGGNVYISGYSKGNGTSYDYATIKYNSSGVQQWIQRFDGPASGDDEPNCMKVDAAGNVFVTGYCTGTSRDCATIRYNSAGVMQWLSIFNGLQDSYDYSNHLVIEPSGNILVAGYTVNSGTGNDFLTIKYNSSGAQKWAVVHDWSNGSEDQAYYIACDSMKNVYVSGWSYANSENIIPTIKYDSLGNEKWEVYTTSSNVEPNKIGIALDAAGNVFVSGTSSQAIGTYHDFVTVKYSQIIGIHPISSEITGNFSISQNFPNPFNPSTKIKFSLPKPIERGVQRVRLTIFDMLGKEVEILVNEDLSAGTYEVTFDASRYSSGLFYYKISAGDYSETKKMILLK